MDRTMRAIRWAVGRSLVAADFQPRAGGWWRRRGTVQQVVALRPTASGVTLAVGLSVDALWAPIGKLVREPVPLADAHARITPDLLDPALPGWWTVDEATIVPLRARAIADVARQLADRLDDVQTAVAVRDAPWCPAVLRARLLHATGDRPGAVRTLRALTGPERAAAHGWIRELRSARRVRRRQPLAVGAD